MGDVRNLYQHLPKHSLSAGGYFEKYPLTIRGGVGTGRPHFNQKKVWFNGDDQCTYPIEWAHQEDSMAHETFELPRVYTPYRGQKPDEKGLYFQFCKTARKPYDLFVCVVLMAFKNHFPEAEIASDGDAKDWEIPVVFYFDVLGKRPDFEGPWIKKEEESAV